MFDLGATEILMIVIAAVILIGPKDLPLALRTAGRWMGKVRRLSNHFRTGLDAMIREAEMEEMEKKWRKQNEEIMAKHPGEHMHAGDVAPIAPSENAQPEALPAPPEGAGAGAEARTTEATADTAKPENGDQPQLPLDKRTEQG